VEEIWHAGINDDLADPIAGDHYVDVKRDHAFAWLLGSVSVNYGASQDITSIITREAMYGDGGIVVRWADDDAGIEYTGWVQMLTVNGLTSDVRLATGPIPAPEGGHTHDVVVLATSNGDEHL
jgi:hypothetical protein